MLNIKNSCQTKLTCLEKIIKSFGLTERIIFIVLAILFILSSLFLLEKINALFLTNTPAYGGSLTEGIIGSPRYINPLLELSDADRDLTYLIYSGLMRTTAEGELLPDLAETYTISPDGLLYTFKIRDDAYFHNGEKVTADDIEYTILMAQDINLRSPKRNSWLGVGVQKISEQEIMFTLKQPYSPFLENTTLGILPKHIWNNANADEFPFSLYNIEPIGSGPYKIEKIKRNASGLPIFYELKSFRRYALGRPYITTIKFNFYSNEKALLEAYLAHEIDSTSSFGWENINLIKSKNESSLLENISLPRIFGVFFNQNHNKIFIDHEVRSALNMTVDRERIVSQVLGGYGQAIDSPIPQGVWPDESEEIKTYNRELALAQAKEILVKAKWSFNEEEHIWEKIISKTETQRLEFSISTSNTNDLKQVAEILKEDWTLLGAKVDVQIYEPNDLNQTVIGQRKYDTLLFGQIINRSLDLFSFWHSSQRNTGYNVAMYTNSQVDKLLEEARQIADQEERLEKYALFEKEIKNDLPAIFIYSPKFTYFLPKKIQGFKSGLVNNRTDRFQEIHEWYIETDRVWNFIAS